MAKSIYATDDEIQAHESLTEALGLQDLCVVRYEHDEAHKTLILTCVPSRPIAICPDCAHVSQEIHDYPKQRKIHDAPVRGYATLLLFDSRRFWCNHCQKSFTDQIRDIVPECTYTYRLASYIADARRKQDVATLAETYGLGYKLVESIILKAANTKLEYRSYSPLQIEHLGIDEISLLKGHGDYVLVLTDLKRRIVLDILPDRTKQSLIDWLMNPPSGIDLSQLTSVAIDLWIPYREAVIEVYPRVSIVADRFHVVQNFHKVIHKIRREAQRNANNDEESSKLKGLRYLLLKDRSKLTDKEKARLSELQRTNPMLYQVYELRQRLHDWYETDTTAEQAASSLQQWFSDALELGITYLDTFCNTLKDWQTQIINFFAKRITSGFVEGMNNKIKLLKRIAFGIPNFEHFRLRILGVCG